MIAKDTKGFNCIGRFFFVSFVVIAFQSLGFPDNRRK